VENSEHGHRRTLLRVRYEWRKSEAESENDCEPDPPHGPPPAGMAGGSLAAKSGPGLGGDGWREFNRRWWIAELAHWSDETPWSA